MGISNYLLVALDPRAHEVLTQKEVQTCMLPKEDEVLWGEDSENFGTVGFKAICNEKPFLVLEIVKDGWDVLWTDVDIVWLSNPFPYFTDVDFTVQQDDDGLCAGFFLLRSTPAGLAWMQRVVDYLNPFIDDQISMRRNIADEKRMTWQYLPRTLFPNGSAYFDLKIPQRKNITPVIIHNNCIIGHRSKVERFQAYGLWFLGPEPPKPSLPTTISPAAVLRSHNEAVTCLTFWQGSLYSASYDKSLRTWNPSNGTLVSTAFPNKRGGVWDIKFVTEEGKTTLWTASHDRLVQSWSWPELSPLKSYDGHLGFVNSVAVTSGLVLAGGDDGTVRTWDRESGKRGTIFKGHTGWVTQLLVDGPALFTCSNDKTARAWHLASGRCLQIYRHEDWVRGLQLHNGRLWTASGSFILSWDFRTGDRLSTLDTSFVTSSFLLHDNRLFQGGEDGVIRVWDGDLVVQVLEGHKDSVSALAFEDGLLASASHDKTISLWGFRKRKDHD